MKFLSVRKLALFGLCVFFCLIIYNSSTFDIAISEWIAPVPLDDKIESMIRFKLYFYYLLVLTYEINVLVFPNFYKCVCVYFVQPVYIHHTRSFECLLENLEST